MRLDLTKLAQLTLVVGALVALGLAEVISADATEGLLYLVAGYVVGDGRSAARGQTSPPLVTPRDPEEGDDG